MISRTATHLCKSKSAEIRFNIMTVFPGVGISIEKIRRSWDNNGHLTTELFEANFSEMLRKIDLPKIDVKALW